MPVVQKGKTILDYGCGPGHDTLLFCLNGAGHVFYYDISPLALEILDMRAGHPRGGGPREPHGHALGCRPWTTSTVPASCITRRTR